MHLIHDEHDATQFIGGQATSVESNKSQFEETK